MCASSVRNKCYNAYTILPDKIENVLETEVPRTYELTQYL
jgi:hypothetical protein